MFVPHIASLMRRARAAAVAALLLAAPSAAAAQDQESYDIPAHVSAVDGVALLERADGGEDLETNLTLVEGDRVRTRRGRAEILFADGTLLHLDRDTVVDFQREDFVRVMEGRVRISLPRDARSEVRIDTPAATLEIEPGGTYRVGVAPNGDAELAVVGGAGAIFNDQGETRLRAGERAVVAVSRKPSEAFYANAAALDDFDRWSDNRQRAHASAVSVQYLPDELRPYGSVFDSYGSWRAHPEYGRVWYPVAAAGWQPYSRGRWHSYPRYGWTWIGNDPWAWPTHHFGRWGFSSGVWFWIPGRSWGPAWVSWARSSGYVGWSPLGWNNRPLFGIGGRRDHIAYSSGFPWCGWSFIRDREFGGRWGRGSLIHGAGITVVTRNGVAGSAIAPLPPRGTRTGTAVPRRGTAVPRTTGTIGSNGSTGSMGSTGSRRSVPRSTGSVGSVGSGGSAGSRRARPRDGDAVSAPADAPRGRAIRRPSGDSGDGASRGAVEAGREPAARRATPRAGAGYPYSSTAPAESSAPRARQPRASERPSEPRARARESQYSQPSPQPWQPRVGEREPRASRRSSPQPQDSAPRETSRARSAAPRGAPAPSAGGGGSGERSAVRRSSGSGGQKAAPPSRRPRGGG